MKWDTDGCWVVGEGTNNFITVRYEVALTSSLNSRLVFE